MTFDEEKKFLEPWAQQAKAGGILVVSVIRAALAQHLGRSVKASANDNRKLTTCDYRILTTQSLRNRRVMG
jgi:hypothetical protein